MVSWGSIERSTFCPHSSGPSWFLLSPVICKDYLFLLLVNHFSPRESSLPMTFSQTYTDYSAQHPLRPRMRCDCTLSYAFPSVPALLCWGSPSDTSSFIIPSSGVTNGCVKKWPNEQQTPRLPDAEYGSSEASGQIFPYISLPPFPTESVLLPNWFPHPQVAGDHRGGDVTGAVHAATGPTSPNLRGDSDGEHLTAGLCHCACISYKKGQRGGTRLSETPCRCVCRECSAPTHNGLLSAQHERDSIKTVSLNFRL